MAIGQRLHGFMGHHRKAVLTLVIIVVSFVTANVLPAFAFSQTVASDGVRIETDKAVYSIGERVEIRLFLVNKLDHSISVCVQGFDLTASNLLGKVYAVGHAVLLGSPCDTPLLPGFEIPAGHESFSLAGPRFLLGEYTIHVSVVTHPDIHETFTGSTEIMVVMWHL